MKKMKGGLDDPELSRILTNPDNLIMSDSLTDIDFAEVDTLEEYNNVATEVPRCAFLFRDFTIDGDLCFYSKKEHREIFGVATKAFQVVPVMQETYLHEVNIESRDGGLISQCEVGHEVNVDIELGLTDKVLLFVSINNN